jgi:hypothetical protein
MDDASDSNDEAFTDEDEYDDEDDEDQDQDTSGWLSRIIYEPWAYSGDLPGPSDVLRRRPELADDPQWAIYLIGSNDGDIEVSKTGLTLAEAREIGADVE